MWAKVVYLVVVLAGAVLVGQVYYHAVHQSHGSYVTLLGYEEVGTFVVVAGVSLLVALPVAVVGLAGLLVRPASGRLAALEGVAAVGVGVLLVVGIVTRVVPWERWDQQAAVFVVLVMGAGVLAALCGHGVRRGLEGKFGV